ncbi:fasciclin domain-containing protein [Caldovatus sp. SYSU G05006]|uniref:Fasciclin domain-containing protein n=1 Tax=Caldovatus aquaticus TaxID=2865671 RepID=A0ABS7F2E2_9PROT|nr:fasciclin domain-containing protein [Caldovatus aquaticus]
MTLWHRRGLFAADAAGLGAAALLLGQGRAARAQTVVAPPGSTVVITPPPAAGRNLADTLAADGRFGRFLELLSQAGLVDALRGAGPFTVLAPADAAFQGAPAATATRCGCAPWRSTISFPACPTARPSPRRATAGSAPRTATTCASRRAGARTSRSPIRRPGCNRAASARRART